MKCEPGHYSAGGVADSCSPCSKNQYSSSEAAECTDCPEGTGGVAAGKGTVRGDCKGDVFTNISFGYCLDNHQKVYVVLILVSYNHQVGPKI